MNAIDNCIRNIRHEIPSEILDSTFKTNVPAGYFNVTNTFAQGDSIDSAIRQHVITERVLMDCNLVGGTTMTLQTESAQRTDVDEECVVFKFDPAITNGLSIVSALEYNFMDVQVLSTTKTGQSRDALDMARASGALPRVGDAECHAVGPHLVMVRSKVRNIGVRGSIVVRVTNDPEFNNLATESYGDLSELSMLAAKAYIYTNRIVGLSRSATVGGLELGIIREIIEGYSDANELYREFLKKRWRAISNMNDHNFMTDHVQSMFGRNFR